MSADEVSVDEMSCCLINRFLLKKRERALNILTFSRSKTLNGRLNIKTFLRRENEKERERENERVCVLVHEIDR